MNFFVTFLPKLQTCFSLVWMLSLAFCLHSLLIMFMLKETTLHFTDVRTDGEFILLILRFLFCRDVISDNFQMNGTDS
jgi:hypothetical protein